MPFEQILPENIKIEYDRWLRLATADPQLISELQTMTDSQIEDAFYKDLEFGTAGLRGVMGAGTNRMNIYTVARASACLAEHLLSQYGGGAAVVIGYDSRRNSDLFARTAAAVFAKKGLKVYLWPHLSPVPFVSFSVRHLKASAGIMITASHNPAEYNGYKVYGPDGCQITEAVADDVMRRLRRTDALMALPVQSTVALPFEGLIEPVDPSVTDAFMKQIRSCSVLYGDAADHHCSIVYTPLNGSGYLPVTRALTEAGFDHLTVVEEQRLPDGDFPTCPTPNPENRQAMTLAIDYARRLSADLVLATDPDCDRVGIAVRDGEDYRLLTGNETGILLLDFICSQKTKHGTMPKDPVLIKSVVTTDLAGRIAKRYGVRTVNVLTGFKYIGEQISSLEQKGCVDSFLFGFEESCGYLSGSHVRDKDGINACLLICEMFSYYRSRGISLLQRLEQLYKEHGCLIHTVCSFAFEGSQGFARMQKTMAALRTAGSSGLIGPLGGCRVLEFLDYSGGLDGLPGADMVKLCLTGGSSVIVRPSGTEPKLKLYISAAGPEEAAARRLEQRITEDIKKQIG
ncbi:MAG: phospho-sugar mutase [Firmicutes bacterium]|nr:phospho-sugar mutase [Bacillota bacterium]